MRRAAVHRGLNPHGMPVTLPSQFCRPARRGPGPVIASIKYAGHDGPGDLPNSYAAVEEIQALRGEIALLDRAVRQVELSDRRTSAYGAC